MITAAAVKSKVDSVLTKFTCPGIQIYKYITPSLVPINRENMYSGGKSDNGRPQFDPPVTVIGRVIINPTYEVVSKYGGNDKEYDVLCVFSVLELERKFGTDLNFTWITTSDRISYLNNTYTLSQVKPSGIVFGEPVEVVCFGTTILGSTLVGP